MGVSVPDAVVTGGRVLVLLEFCEDKKIAFADRMV